MLITNSSNVAETLNQMETAHGTWTSYGDSGQTTTQEVEGNLEGTGYKARFKDNPNGPDHGWGPLAKSEEEAVSLFLIKAAANLRLTLKAAIF
ncbi:MAG: hypothetical protein O9253_02310 [Aquidulcibacter sp.]|jgi:hypothetical protein|nr:hypothetical protein [Aquidulcibacter sp.]